MSDRANYREEKMKRIEEAHRDGAQSEGVLE